MSMLRLGIKPGRPVLFIGEDGLLIGRLIVTSRYGVRISFDLPRSIKIVRSEFLQSSRPPPSTPRLPQAVSDRRARIPR